MEVTLCLQLDFGNMAPKDLLDEESDHINRLNSILKEKLLYRVCTVLGFLNCWYRKTILETPSHYQPSKYTTSSWVLTLPLSPPVFHTLGPLFSF